MRTEEQVKRVAQNYGLDRSRLSILLHKRHEISDQGNLTAIAFDLKRAPDSLVNRLLGSIVSPYRGGSVKSQWGSQIIMKGDRG